MSGAARWAKVFFLFFVILIVPHIRADIATVLVGGVDDQSDIFQFIRTFLFKTFPYKSHLNNAAGLIDEHMSAIQRKLGLGLGYELEDFELLLNTDRKDFVSSEATQFIKIIEGLSVDENDRPMKRKVLEFLARNENEFVGTPKEFRELIDVLSDMTRLVHRYGENNNTMLFPYPAPIPRKNSDGDIVFEEFVTFKSFLQKDVHDIAKQYVPSKDRSKLENILMEELPRLGFSSPYSYQIDHISTERLALTVLLIQAAQHGGEDTKVIAGNLLRAYRRGSSRNFFDVSNTTNLDAFFFDIEDTSLSTKIFDGLPEKVANFCGIYSYSIKPAWDRALQSRLGRIRNNKGNLPIFKTMEGDVLRIQQFTEIKIAT